MKSLNIPQRFFIFLLLVLALTCLVSPWMALGANWFAARSPDFLTEQIPFSRVFNRAFMIVAISLLIAGRHLLFPSYLKELVVVRFSDAWLNLLTGFALAVVSFVFLLTLMAAADVYTPYFRLPLAESLSRLAGALASGVFAGFMEEVFFRGLMFLGLYDSDRPLRAYLLFNLFYSAIHFVKPDVAYFLDHLDPFVGFRHLLTTFEPFLEPLRLLPGICGLFLIGVVLSYALARTGNLYLSVGLHAGWIVGLKMIRVFGDFSREQLGWAFGATDPKIISGVATWIGVLLVGLAVRQLTRRDSRLVTDQPPAATV